MESSGQARAGQEILNAVRQRLLALGAEEHAAKSARIGAILFRELFESDLMMIYVSVHPEVSTIGLIQLLYRQNRRVILAVTGPGTPGLSLSFLHKPATPPAIAFAEPVPDETEILLQRSGIDSVTVPVQAFDRSGRTLADANGNFARFLATVPRARKIGLAFACQETGAVPDCPGVTLLDCIITEDGAIRRPPSPSPAG